jgi:hypothetical protein
MTTLADCDAPPGRAFEVPTWGILLIFTVSGATGLMLEVVWSRMLVTLLGATTWGVMVTLVAFLGALGLGGLLLGPRASRSSRPLRFYGMLELGVGAYCLAVPALFSGIGLAYISATRQLQPRRRVRPDLRGDPLRLDSPRFRGNASLDTRDYLGCCAERLQPGGIVSTWLALYGLPTEDVRTILASFRAVFPLVQLW